MRNLTHEEWVKIKLSKFLQSVNKWIILPPIYTRLCSHINDGYPSYLFIQVSMGNTTYEFGIN